MSHRYLWFSGTRLYLVNGAATQSWLAVSGKAKAVDATGIKFEYSKTAQASKDHGPLPAGEYGIRTGDIRTYQHTGSTYAKAMAYLVLEQKTDYLKRINNAWGKMEGATGRIVPILNRRGGTDYAEGRNRCWIHGSDFPGSIGCIDLSENMDAFLDSLLKLRFDPKQQVQLFVKYGVGPDGSRESKEIDIRGRDVSRVA